jgi:hypothetical protein
MSIKNNNGLFEICTNSFFEIPYLLLDTVDNCTNIWILNQRSDYGS